MDSPIRIIGVILSVLLGIFIFYKYYEKLEDPTIDATVLKSKIIKDEGKYKTYRLTVKYTIGEKDYINKVTKKTYKKEYKKDDSIVINYKKKNPNKIEVEVLRDFPKRGEGMLFGLISVYCCLPLILVVVIISFIGGGFTYFMED